MDIIQSPRPVGLGALFSLAGGSPIPGLPTHRWNGYEIPVFPRSSVDTIVANLNPDDVKWEGSTLCLATSGEWEGFAPVMVDGIPHWQVGDGWMWHKIHSHPIQVMWEFLHVHTAEEGGNDPYVAALGAYKSAFGRFPSEESDPDGASALCGWIAAWASRPHPLTGLDGAFYYAGTRIPSTEIPPSIGASIRWEISRGAAMGSLTVDGVEYAWD